MKSFESARKGLLVLVIMVASCVPTWAQLSAGAELNIPVGDFSEVYNVGYGISARWEQNINEDMTWTAQIGYSSYGSKFSILGSASIIPVVGGFKYYPNGAGEGFYAGGDLGLYFVSIPYDNGFTSGTTSETKFGVAPLVGYKLKNLDFGARFALPSNVNHFSIRVAYCFNISGN